MKPYLWRVLFGVIVLLVPFAWATADEPTIRIDDPWVREAPPMARVSAAYMIIENLSSQPKILLSATSPAFGRIEIHKTIIHTGMMQMQAQPQLVIAAHEQVTLAPGGYHLMLMEGQESLSIGDEVTLTLQFADDEEITLTMPVRKFTPPQMHHHHHNH